ncbi:dethiobiotin synthetase [Phytomonospora endophytica]|uniref:ATP-dependent dethiobiotin synthetase BioD n=1 Tax=Phytomonospora endophytica TaxID=714109 RepID=A0A841FQX4_9ACTN|nr:dethiobiotin synthetase [Phytomonospora endophytica]GIG70661.1 ATP-dependent dethiobiotin synthetase BioD [Phytomonospora endophytica]
MTPLIVTGTDTGVGKTVVTAAVAAAAAAVGLEVAVLKPAQSGGDDDAATVTRLSGVTDSHALVSFPDALSPLAAARASGAPPLPMTDVIKAVYGCTADVLLIEGAGGLLVQMGERGWTIADLCAALQASAIVVARAGLGTLNHTALTLEALDARGIGANVVVGAMPRDPEPVHETNLTTLTEMSGGLAGIVPEGAGGLSRAEFTAAAPGWLTGALYGTL